MRLTSLGQVPLEKWQFVFSEKDHLRGVGSVSPGTSCWGMSLSIQEVVGLGGSHSWRQGFGGFGFVCLGRMLAGQETLQHR